MVDEFEKRLRLLGGIGELQAAGLVRVTSVRGDGTTVVEVTPEGRALLAQLDNEQKD
jgi:DNA-binding MarR family transcriptional regulator